MRLSPWLLVPAAAALLLGAAGLFVLLGGPGLPASPDAAANERVAADAQAVAAVVAAHAEHHDGRPPTLAELRAMSRLPQLVEPGAFLVGVNRHGKGEPYTTFGTTEVVGKLPVGELFGPTTFGAIAYDADPAARRWVIYGLGRMGELISVEEAIDESSAR